MRLPNGSVLRSISGKQYRLIEEMGSSIATSVYLALDVETNAPVAIKTVSREMDPRGRFEQRFRREAKLLNELDSPHIVRILDFGAEREYLFFVMEHIPGKGLDQIIADKAPMDEIEALALIRQVVQALRSTYEKGIIHRDIKPQNIRVTQEGLVKILDFGIATHVNASSITTTSDFLGTLAYLSPEQTDDPDKVDIRSDIYSTGAVLYEMLTGRVPFEGDSPLQLVTKIVTRNPVPIRQYRNTIIREVEELVDRCLAKDPAERFQTPQEFLAAIDRIDINKYRDRRAYLYAQAEAAFRVHDWDTALRLCEDILAIDPHYRDVQQFIAEIKDVRQKEIRANLARLLQQAEQAYQSRRWDKAIELCQEVLYFDPNHEAAKELLTRVQRGRGQAVLVTASGREFPLTKAVTWIGRPDAIRGVPDVDLSTEQYGRTVSRRHAHIRCEDGQWWLVIEEKTENESFLNNELLQRSSKTLLRDGDTIRLGGVFLRFQIKTL